MAYLDRNQALDNLTRCLVSVALVAKADTDPKVNVVAYRETAKWLVRQ